MPNWRLAAACIGTDPELFFMNDAAAKLQARRICADCPVRRECLDFAMDNEQPENQWESPVTNLRKRNGIFAGLTAQERWSIRYPRASANLRLREAARRRKSRAIEVK